MADGMMLNNAGLSRVGSSNLNLPGGNPPIARPGIQPQIGSLTPSNSNDTVNLNGGGVTGDHMMPGDMMHDGM